MKHQSCRIVLRPRGPFQTFDLTVLFLRAYRRELLRLGGMIVLPLWAGFSLIAWFAGGWTLLLVFGVLGWMQSPFTIFASEAMFGVPRSASAYLKSLVDGPAWLLVAIRFGTWTTLLFSAGMSFILFPTLFYLPETTLVERNGFSKTLSRSTSLAGRQTGNVLVGWAARWFLTFWMMIVCEGVGQGLLGTALQLGTPLGSLTQGDATPFAIFGILAAQPIAALYRWLLYIDTRTASEGWDLQVAFWTATSAREAS